MFAGCRIRQDPDNSSNIDQNEYSEQWMGEVEMTTERAQQLKSPATNAEISQLRGVIGTLAWTSSQTSPHYQADVGLILSEIPYATVSTLVKANKLVREMRRSPQSLKFPHWNVPWKELAVIVWADASNSNRPDRSSTMGLWLAAPLCSSWAVRAIAWPHYSAIVEDPTAMPRLQRRGAGHHRGRGHVLSTSSPTCGGERLLPDSAESDRGGARQH